MTTCKDCTRELEHQDALERGRCFVCYMAYIYPIWMKVLSK